MFRNILLAIGTVIGLSKVYKGYETKTTSENLNFTPVGVKWNGISKVGLKFNIIYEILNPTNSNITINYLFTDVFLSTGTKITSINKEAWNKTIGKEAVTKTSIPVKIYWTDLFFVGRSVFNLLKSGKKPDTLILKGFVKANDFSVKFNETIKVL